MELGNLELATQKLNYSYNHEATQKETTLQLQDKLLIKRGNMLIKVVVADILYIESENRYCYIHTEDTRFLVQKSLKSLAETLPKSFVSLHRKHVINTNQIQSIFPTDYTLTLKNNVTLPVSQRHRKLLLNLFTIIK